MNYKSVKLPADFVEEVKNSAEMEYRSVSQQLLYWAKIGQEVAKSYFIDGDDEHVERIAFDRYSKKK